MTRICIFGSCVSRDILNRMDSSTFELQFYSARSSFGALFADPPFEDRYSQNLASAFQRRMLQMDIQKTSIQIFSSLHPDVILVDLIDERFDLVRGASGGLCTWSTELKNSGFQMNRELLRIPTHSDKFLRYWTRGWDKFVELLDYKGLLGAVAVNRTFYQSHTVSGVAFDNNLVRETNKKLERMYRIQARTLSSEQFIEYPSPRRCPDNHHWGTAPFHYDDESTEFAARWVEKFAARRITASETK